MNFHTLGLMQKERLENIDILRGVAIILVVLGHTLPSNGPNSILRNFIYSFHMPLFMCISGFVTRYSYTFNLKSNMGHFSYIYRKFKSLMVPYMVWGGIISPLFFFDWKNRIDFAKILKSMFVTNQSYWFLPCLFGLIVIFSLYMALKGYFQKKIWFVDLLCLSFFLTGITGCYYLTKYDFFRSIVNYFLPFFIGVYAAENERFRSSIFLNVHIYTSSFIGFCLICGIFSDNMGGITNRGIRLLTGLFSLPVIFYLVEHIKIMDLVRKQLVFIGKNTLVVYLMSGFFIGTAELIEIETLNFTQQLILLGSYSLIVTYICIGLSKFFEISPVLSFLALGKNMPHHSAH